MITIPSVDEFMKWAQPLKQTGAYFRGQTRDYGTMIPSLFRKKTTLDIEQLGTQLQEYFDEAYTVWEEYRGSLPKEDPQVGYETPVGVFPQLSGEFGNGDEYADPYDDDVDEGDWSFTGYGRIPKIVGHGFPEIWPAYHARLWANAGEVRCALLQHYGTRKGDRLLFWHYGTPSFSEHRRLA
jgi:hypothetical protein